MGSEMCIRDREMIPVKYTCDGANINPSLDIKGIPDQARSLAIICLLYTSDAADERSSVDLGGRRIIKKKNHPP